MYPGSSLLLAPVVGISAGIIAQRFGCNLLSAGILISAALLVYLLVIHVSRDPVKGFVLNRLHYIWIVLIFCAIGIVDASLTSPYSLEGDLGNVKHIVGRVETITNTNHGDQAIVEVLDIYGPDTDRLSTPRLKLLVHSDVIGAEPDEVVFMPVQLYKICDSKNYFFEGHADRLRNQGILYGARCNSNDIKVIATDKTFSGLAQKIRKEIETAIEKSGVSTRTAHFLITILIGNRDYLGLDRRNLYADAGISHILALSGMHVGIIAGIVLWILIPFNLTGRHKIRLLITLAILFSYAFVTGWAPSTVRSVLMVGAVTICILLERKNNSWNALLFATLLILLFTPSALFDAGFQLSFVCVAALIFFANQLNPVDHHSYPRLYKTIAFLISTICATMATWCLIAYYFGKFPLVFLPANMLILPWLPLFLIGSIIFITFSACGIQLHIVGSSLDFILEQTEAALSWLTNGGSTAISCYVSGVSVCLWMVVLICLACIVNSRNKRPWVYAIGSCLFLFISSLILSTPTGKQDGIIVQTTPGSVHLLTRINQIEEPYAVKRNTLMRFNIKGDEILVIDGTIEGHEELLNKHYKAVVLAGGVAKDASNLLSKIRTECLITHTTIRKKREKEILSMADSIGIQTHSLRNQGAWRYIRKE